MCARLWQRARARRASGCEINTIGAAEERARHRARAGRSISRRTRRSSTRREAAPAHQSAAHARLQEPGMQEVAAKAPPLMRLPRRGVARAFRGAEGAAGGRGRRIHGQPAPGARPGLLQSHRVRVGHATRSARRARSAAAGATTGCSSSSAASPRRLRLRDGHRAAAGADEGLPATAPAAPRAGRLRGASGRGRARHTRSRSPRRCATRGSRWCCTRAAAASSRR